MNDFVQTVPLPGRLRQPVPTRASLWHAVVLALLLGWLYWPILFRLAGQWWNDPNFSHGFFVPAFSFFVLWQKREQLAALPLRPSWTGILILLFALGLLVVGVLGAELFLSRSSLLLLLAGLVVYFLGWGHLRAVLFPWLFLFLMIPIPSIIFNEITFPLQLLASRLASTLLPLAGVPVLREGNVILLPAMALEVAEACSGIRSLMSLATLAVMYGYVLEKHVAVRVLLALAAIPIAVIANSLRIVGTGLLVQYWDPDKAQGFFHTFSGWIIFVFSLALLLLLHWMLHLLPRWREPEAAA
jgi:exosortase